MVVAFVAFLVGVGLAALTKNAVVGLAAAAIVMIVGFLATRGRRR